MIKRVPSLANDLLDTLVYRVITPLYRLLLHPPVWMHNDL